MERLEAIVICGPTAAGKTAKAIELADALNGEIVSVDSMQVYRGMDIGTAKPDAETLKKYPHHLVNILNPDEGLNAQDFADRAMAAIRNISGRGKLPLLTGGTGLYFKALLEGLFEGPAANPEIRERLRKMADDKGRKVLHDYLRTLDPETAEVIHPNNLHRVIRAIEVCEVTGEKMSNLKKNQSCQQGLVVKGVEYVNPDRKVLYSNIDNRTEQMFHNGLVEETRDILDQYGPAIKALKAIGYNEAVGVLQGKLTLAEAKELVKKNTRNYAKRQITWFTHQRMAKVSAK